jgi:hypothetical protein
VKYKPIPDYTPQDMRAMQSLAAYAATAQIPDDNVPLPSPHEVKRALDWIVEKAALTFDTTYYENDRDSNHAQGRRSVGLSIIKMQNMKVDVIDAGRSTGSTRGSNR